MPEVYDLDNMPSDKDSGSAAAKPAKQQSRIEIGDSSQYKPKRRTPPPPNPKAQAAKGVVLALITVAAIAFIVYYVFAPKHPNSNTTETTAPQAAVNRPISPMGTPGPVLYRGNRSYNPAVRNMGNPNGGAPGFAPQPGEDRPAQPDGIR